MNERIRELARQAGVFAGDFAGAGLYSIHNKEEVEKFAEMIVGECYLWAKENGGLGCEEDFEALKEHFRVEE
jgi:hypothetical protein